MKTELAGVYQAVFPYGLGVFLAAAMTYAARRMQSDERWFWTWLMGIVVVGFVGFPLSTGDASGAAAEAAVLVVLGAGLVWSWIRRAATLLAAVYFAHGASDLVHLLTELSPTNPDWIHEFCIPFDWLIGGYILRRRQSWLATGGRST